MSPARLSRPLSHLVHKPRSLSGQVVSLAASSPLLSKLKAFVSTRHAPEGYRSIDHTAPGNRIFAVCIDKQDRSERQPERIMLMPQLRVGTGDRRFQRALVDCRPTTSLQQGRRAGCL